MNNVKCRAGSLNQKAQEYFEVIFEENSEKGKKCKIENCGKVLVGKRPSNLVSHIKCSHPELYSERFENADEKINYALLNLEFIQNCTEIVTYNGRAFNSLMDSGFQKMVAGQSKELADNGFVINLSDKNHPKIKEYLHLVAVKIRNQIKKEVCDKQVAVMADSATNSKSILGVSIQFVSDGKIIIRNVGMCMLTKSNTGKYLRNVIETCLSAYDITPAHIISVTTDNGKNMISMTKQIGKNYETNDSESSDSEAEYIENTVGTIDGNPDTIGEISDQEISNIIHQYEGINDDDELNTILDDPIEGDTTDENSTDEDRNRVLLEDMANDFTLIHHNISSIRCAAHTLQLAIKDALVKSSINSFISFCREIVKTLRTTLYRYAMYKLGLDLKPCIDCPTRWGSTYLMVRKLDTRRISNLLEIV